MGRGWGGGGAGLVRVGDGGRGVDFCGVLFATPPDNNSFWLSLGQR